MAFRSLSDFFNLIYFISHDTNKLFCFFDVAGKRLIYAIILGIFKQSEGL